MDVNGGKEVEALAPAPMEIRIEGYPEFCIPVVECLPFQPLWEDWPAWPPPPDWKYTESIDALHEACQPHKLPPNVELGYGPFLPWTIKPPPQSKLPTVDLPMREYLVIEIWSLVAKMAHIELHKWSFEGLMVEKVYDLCLEAMKLAVIERPERLVKFLALYIQEKNPLACKVKYRRHCHLGETCHCKTLPPPPPPPPLEPPKKNKKAEGEEETKA